MIATMSKLRPDEKKTIRRKRAQGCGVRQIAYDINRDPATVSRLLNGRTHAAPRSSTLTVDELHIVRANEPCPKCDQMRPFKTIRNVCLDCDVKELERRGLVEIGIQ